MNYSDSSSDLETLNDAEYVLYVYGGFLKVITVQLQI